MNMFPNLDGRVIAYDTETTGLGPADMAFGFSVAFDGWSGYFDIRRTPEAVRWLSDARPARIVCHNASFDYRMSARAGIRMDVDLLDDTVIRACLIDEHLQSYSLDDLALKYLKKRKQSEIYPQLAELFGGRATRNVQMPNIAKAPPEIVGPYAIRDAELTLELWKWQEDEIARQGIQEIVSFERRLMPTLIRTEMRGIRVDVPRAEAAQKQLTTEIDKQQSELDRLAGGKFNVNSTPQVRKMFNPKVENGIWVADNGTYLEPTESGQPSINSLALREMGDDRRAELILSIRSLIKTRDTFLGGHVIESAYNGRVYPTINQNKGEDGGTGTGRLSYTGPAMQQIPSRNKKVAAIVKPVFLPDEGQIWVDADMQSFEVRVFAHLVNDPHINAAYTRDPLADFHQMVAGLTGLPRNASYSGEANAKQMNLSMIFNSGNGAIAEKMGMEWSWEQFEAKNGEIVRYKKAGPEAMAIINNYHSQLPGVKNLADRAKDVATSRGYVKTKYGRRMRFPNPRFSYKASGLLIQSTAADINKNNWMLLEGVTQAHGGNIILNTHDSYSLSLPEDNWEKAWAEAEEAVRFSYPWFRVPLILELSGHGVNWWEAVK